MINKKEMYKPSMRYWRECIEMSKKYFSVSKILMSNHFKHFQTIILRCIFNELKKLEKKYVLFNS